MLGRLRRTTRLDVGLALAFSGLSYLVWCLVAGVSRDIVEVIRATSTRDALKDLPKFTRVVYAFFADIGFAIDLTGLAWLVLSLLLVVYAGRQRLSISWAWLAATSQAFVAALGGVLVGYAMNLPYRHLPSASHVGENLSELSKLSELSLWVVLTLAILIWTSFLVWLLVEAATFKKRGPSLRDGMRSNIYR